MILLDTHIWVWWLDGGTQLPPGYLAYLRTESPNGVGVTAISCWEIAKLVELGRLRLSMPVEEWLSLATQAPIQMFPLTTEIAVESTRLPGTFHRDPADQLIVATARVPSRHDRANR